MNTKRIIFWASFIIILALIVWGLIASMNKLPRRNLSNIVPGPVTAADHIRGNPNAPVTVIEYEDFQCPACGTYFPVMEKLFNESSTTMRLVFRHFPLTQHANAIPAAEASEAAATQGKFWEMYSLLYANQNDWSEKPHADAESIFEGYATTLGLDITKFKADLVSSTTAAIIVAGETESRKIGIDHTPTYFVNGKETNFATYEEIKKTVDEAAAAATK